MVTVAGHWLTAKIQTHEGLRVAYVMILPPAGWSTFSFSPSYHSWTLVWLTVWISVSKDCSLLTWSRRQGRTVFLDMALWEVWQWAGMWLPSP